MYFALYTVKPRYDDFLGYCEELSEGLSQPSIMFKARLRDGTEIIVDDYREAYWWLRDHTPKDSRILAWWDYGYQITGIGGENKAGRREHVEPRAHRDSWVYSHKSGGPSAQDRETFGGLCARVGRRWG